MQFKISLLGEGSVGKTSLKNRVITGKFTDLYLTTLGVDFSIYNLKLADKGEVQLAIWDIAGQKNFSTIRESYFEGSSGGIVVFDVTRPETLTKIKDNWIIPFFKKLQEPRPILIIANKIDLKNERNVSEQQIKDYLALIRAELELSDDKLPFIEVSVKDNINVMKAVEEFTKLLIIYNEEKLLT